MTEKHDVLVLAEHEQITELLVEFCAAAGHHAVWPRRYEPIEAAYLRTMPQLVILDFELASRLPSAWLNQLAEHGAHLLLFSGCYQNSALRAYARETGVAYFSLPIAWRDFMPILTAAFDE